MTSTGSCNCDAGWTGNECDQVASDGDVVFNDPEEIPTQYENLLNISATLRQKADAGSLDTGYATTGIIVDDPEDECGVKGGDGTSCLDECGVPNGDGSSCASTPSPTAALDLDFATCENVTSISGASERQEVWITASDLDPASSNGFTGTFALRFNGETTAAISVYANAADILAALLDLATTRDDGISVIGLLANSAVSNVSSATNGVTQLRFGVEFPDAVDTSESVQNVGPMPSLSVDTSLLVGDFKDATVSVFCVGAYRRGYNYAEQRVSVDVGSTSLASAGGTIFFRLNSPSQSCGNGTSAFISPLDDTNNIAAALRELGVGLFGSLIGEGRIEVFLKERNTSFVQWSVRFYTLRSEDFTGCTELGALPAMIPFSSSQEVTVSVKVTTSGRVPASAMPIDFIQQANQAGEEEVQQQEQSGELTPVSLVYVCGDGVYMTGEGCDDGNSNAGDGCNANCTVEAGYVCNNPVSFTSSCTIPTTPTIQFSVNTFSAVPENSTVTIWVERLGNSSTICTLRYTTVDSDAKHRASDNNDFAPGNTSALSGDFDFQNGTLAFGPNIALLSISIPVNNDGVYDGAVDETFVVRLFEPSTEDCALVGGAPVLDAFIEIRDSNPAPTTLPTSFPTVAPTSAKPTAAPTSLPTIVPSTAAPSPAPANTPTKEVPTAAPSVHPSLKPTTDVPSLLPTSFPSTTCAEDAGTNLRLKTADNNLTYTVLNRTDGAQLVIGRLVASSNAPRIEWICSHQGCYTLNISRVSNNKAIWTLASSGASVSGIGKASLDYCVQDGQLYNLPTAQPTISPEPSNLPTSSPSLLPTLMPSSMPSALLSPPLTSIPSNTPSHCPSPSPSKLPSSLSSIPSYGLPLGPSLVAPTTGPSILPTMMASSPVPVASSVPTSALSSLPTVLPSASLAPTVVPTSFPTALPSTFSDPTGQRTADPTTLPSSSPSLSRINTPSGCPTAAPSSNPTVLFAFDTTALPSAQPFSVPSVSPSPLPSRLPLDRPTLSLQPTHPFIPTSTPTASGTAIIFDFGVAIDDSSHSAASILASDEHQTALETALSEGSRLLTLNAVEVSNVVETAASQRRLSVTLLNHFAALFARRLQLISYSISVEFMVTLFPEAYGLGSENSDSIASAVVSNISSYVDSGEMTVAIRRAADEIGITFNATVPSQNLSINYTVTTLPLPDWYPTPVPSAALSNATLNSSSYAPTIYKPSVMPSYQPTYKPSYQPTYKPSYQPTYEPSRRPSSRSVYEPTRRSSMYEPTGHSSRYEPTGHYNRYEPPGNSSNYETSKFVKMLKNTALSPPTPAPTEHVCRDITSWSKKGEPWRGCSWVSSSLERCQTRGQDGTYAYQSCKNSASAFLIIPMSNQQYE